LGFFISFSAAAKNACDTWIKKSGAVPQSKDCFATCVRPLTDMNTLTCPFWCPQFCKRGLKTDLIFKISDLYPGLTASERAIVAENPPKALKAYILSWKADSVCSKRFGQSRTNDESDACRHFMWAGLMENELGSEWSQRILEAHETVPLEPERERAMDLANNRLGLLNAAQLTKEKKFSETELMNTFEDALKRKALIILKPRIAPTRGVDP
jgi:hypothetical protein